MNQFDLDGRMWGWLKKAVKVVTKVAEIASYIPGPIGMVASGVAVAGNLAQGNYKKAAEAALGLIPGGKLIATAAKAAKVVSKTAKATKVLKKVSAASKPAIKPRSQLRNLRRQDEERQEVRWNVYNINRRLGSMCEVEDHKSRRQSCEADRGIRNGTPRSLRVAEQRTINGTVASVGSRTEK